MEIKISTTSGRDLTLLKLFECRVEENHDLRS